MKYALGLLLILANAGSAAAEGSKPHHYTLPGYPPAAPPSTSHPYRAPEPQPFKPYQPYEGQSVYSQPPRATPGAKPCETSVYVDACRRR